MIWLSSLPKVIQLEPTNACNFSCLMCLSSSWQQKTKSFFPLDAFSKLSDEFFHSIDRLVLYGMGEPLMHPSFLEMLQIAKRSLSATASLVFLTNGSLLIPKISNEILENGLADEITFSCETLKPDKYSITGHSQNERSVQTNLQYLLKHSSRSNVKVGVETVLMKSNFKQLPDLVKSLGELGVDYLSVSHIYPYNSSLTEEVFYTMISDEALLILDELGEDGWDFILGITREQFGEKMQHTFKEQYKIKHNVIPKDRPFTQKYKELLRKAKENNVTLNIPLYMNERDKIKEFQELQSIFSLSKNKAEENGIELLLPSTSSNFKKRKCPYVAAEAVVIRSDGEVAPCFKYLYDHNSSLNQHERESSSYSFGNIKTSSLNDIWNSSVYSKFRDKLNQMNESIPFCGNCGLSSNNCFYATEDTSDCWGNEPFCAECPYSLNLTTCLL